MKSHARGAGTLALLAGLAAAQTQAQVGFVNWETPQVSPVALTPDGTRLLAVNTADNRLEVFDVTGAAPVRIRSIPVGLDPVSVRARTNGEAWVVNHISDSVSVVDIASGRVLRTLAVNDGPADVVFAGTTQRAFVSCAKANQVMVFDPASPATAPTTIAIAADEPRALAVSPDGSRVYAAVFFSGNNSTILPANVVSNPGGPYAGRNPPPNSGNTFDPPINPALPTPPTVALIVKRDPVSGTWVDDNIGNWSSFVTWTLADRDVAILDANNLASPVTFANGLMNINMAIAVKPDGTVTTIGTDGDNEIRFEEKVNGVFVRNELASFSPANPNGTRVIADINPHLSYAAPTTTEALREQSVGDPRAIVWNADGSAAYIAGMGSNNVAIVGPSGARLGLIDVGDGPTGLALAGAKLYVLNRFEGSISTIDTATNAELSRTSFFDPTPSAIRNGRPFLYNTHMTSGLGQASCGSCHVDAKADGLAWDLGAVTGSMKTVNQPCRQGPNGCAPWHPMKGPMVTQSLQGIVGAGAMHWRGDKENVAAFNPAFDGLQGSEQRSDQEMQLLHDYIATIAYPPNPNRNTDGTLRNTLAVSNGSGNPQNGLTLYNTAPRFGPPGPGGLTCVVCHTLPNGTDQRIDFPGPPAANQSLKNVALRGQEEKLGFNRGQPNSTRGFGYNHDGTGDTLFNLFAAPPFSFPNNPTGQQERRDMEAFFLSLTNDTHAAVGRQITLNGANNSAPAVVAALDQFKLLADTNQVGLVVKGIQSGLERGYVYVGTNTYQSDRQSEAVSDVLLRAAATAGSELTWTVVPIGTQRRIGIDRDVDTVLDRDELDQGYNPADPFSSPLAFCAGDANLDRAVSFADVTAVLANYGQLYTNSAIGPGDADRSGRVNFGDVTMVLANFGTSCQ
jgi:YVTN family beta-propeller protein